MKPSRNILSFAINGSLRKREVQAQPQTSYTEYYLFNSATNLKAYSNNGLDFAYYGYNAANTRTYKLSFLNANSWVNGQQLPIHPQSIQAMFYPNAYLNFNQNGEYTKHYYNGSERIASRLGTVTLNIATTANARLNTRSVQLEDCFRNDIRTLVYAGDIPMDLPPEPVSATSLQQTGTPDDIFYYHTNHLGSTAFVTDQNQNITQGFLYAPFGEITTEYAPMWQNGTLPKYSFNAKELDEETGMYYYEARYYKPPVFTSRDPMFEKYFWMTPYAYCANNPVKYVDPDGREGITVSGSPGDHKNKRHFLENGLDRAIRAKNHFQRKGESSTWIIYNDKKNGFSSDLIDEYKKKAANAGINVKVVSEVKDIIDYVNNKNGGNTREKDKITSFYYLGHATPGDLKVGYKGTEEDFDPSDFNADAFSSGTFVDVVGGCRTAINWGIGLFDPSIIKQFSKILDKKSEIRGSDVRVQYNGGVMTDKQLVGANKGNIVKINGRLD